MLTATEAILVQPDREEMFAATIARQCIKRREEPKDLLGATVFLASASSDFVTGQLLFADAGAVLGQLPVPRRMPRFPVRCLLYGYRSALLGAPAARQHGIEERTGHVGRREEGSESDGSWACCIATSGAGPRLQPAHAPEPAPAPGRPLGLLQSRRS